jgi:hypothetical protein
MKPILLASLLLISASGSAIAEDLHGTLYKNQSCQCCESHAKYLRENGIDVDVVAVPNFEQISSHAGVPSAFQGCHMIKLDGYVFEGHITSEMALPRPTQRNSGPHHIPSASLYRWDRHIPGRRSRGR